MNLDKLRGLQIDDLRLLADKIGLNLPDDLDPSIVLLEIVDALEEDSLDNKTALNDFLSMEEMKFSSTEGDSFDMNPEPGIDLHYSETVLRVMVRDPTWAFAFWDLSEFDKKKAQATQGFSGYSLRLIEYITLEDGKKGYGDFHEIEIKESDVEWYISLPESGKKYVVELCVNVQGSFLPISRSSPFASPRAHVQKNKELDSITETMLELSGLSFYVKEDLSHKNPLRILDLP